MYSWFALPMARPRVVGLLVAGLIIIMGAAVSVFGGGSTSPVSRAAASADRSFTLYVRDAVLAAPDGSEIYVWGFTDDPSGPAKIPGPLIEVELGEMVEVTLINDRDPTTSALLPFGEGHTIHLHGLDTTTEHDGVPETFEPGLVREGGSYTYRFLATHAGTFFYHCHQNNVEHQQMGMFGGLVVRPAGASLTAYPGGPAFDREEVLVLAEMDLYGHDQARRSVKEDAHPHNWLSYSPSHYLINDRIWTDPSNIELAIDAQPGERVLVRAINSGYVAHALSAPGSPFEVVGSDGRAWPAGIVSGSLWLGPGEKYDLLFSGESSEPIRLRDEVDRTDVGPVLGAGQLRTPAPAPAQGPERSFTLYPAEGTQRLADDAQVYVRGFSDRPGGPPLIPGPALVATEGDRVTITLAGAEAGSAGIEIVGLDLPLEPQVNSQTGTTSYRFVAARAGSYFYRSISEDNAKLGAYGAFVIEPRGGARTIYREGPTYDLQYTMVLSELDSTWHDAARQGVYGRAGSDYRPNYFLINGRAFPDTTVDPGSMVHALPGERVLIRTLNAGQLPHAMHLHGYHFQVAGRYGRPWANGPLKDTVLIAPGDSYDLLFVADQAGAFPFHDHYEIANTNNGVWLGGMHTMVVTGLEYQAICPLPSQQLVADAVAPADGDVPNVFVRDNFYTPRSVTIPVGGTVRWEHQGRVLHTVSSLQGVFESGPLSAGSVFAFTFDRPGRYDYFCRFHLTNRGVIMVE